MTKWKPSRITLHKINDSLDNKKAFKAFRGSSSGYISRKDVRDIVFKKNAVCCICGSHTNLTVDHILSVLHCFYNNLINYCNTIENLQTLCNKCNNKKSHY